MRRSLQKPGAAILAAMTLGCMAGAAGQRGGRMGPDGFGAEGTRYINPGTLAALDGFTHAVKVGLTIYVSGEVPLDSLGHLVGPGDLRAQARQAFANLAFVLQIAGAAPADVSKLDIYVVNLHAGDVAVIKEAGADFFPQRDPPAGIVLGVQSLPREGMLIAIDAIANPRGLIPPRVRNERP